MARPYAHTMTDGVVDPAAPLVPENVVRHPHGDYHFNGHGLEDRCYLRLSSGGKPIEALHWVFCECGWRQHEPGSRARAERDARFHAGYCPKRLGRPHDHAYWQRRRQRESQDSGESARVRRAQLADIERTIRDAEQRLHDAYQAPFRLGVEVRPGLVCTDIIDHPHLGMKDVQAIDPDTIVRHLGICYCRAEQSAFGTKSQQRKWLDQHRRSGECAVMPEYPKWNRVE